MHTKSSVHHVGAPHDGRIEKRILGNIEKIEHIEHIENSINKL